MLALFISATVVAVERFINRKRLKIHEIMRDVGWLTLLFALIEFAYLFIVESGTLAYGSAMRPLWYTEWSVFKDLFVEAAVGVFLILSSVWLEQAGITSLRISLRRPRLPLPHPSPAPTSAVSKCDVEW
jgi:hypothetical protein